MTNALTTRDQHVNSTNGWDILSSIIAALTMIAILAIASPTIIAFRNIDINLSELLLSSIMGLSLIIILTVSP